MKIKYKIIVLASLLCLLFGCSQPAGGGSELGNPDNNEGNSSDKTYKINYIVEEGVTPPEQNWYKAGMQIFLVEPNRTGYEFTGWLNERNQKVTQIMPTDRGDKTFTASWKAVNYKINYDWGNGTAPEGIYPTSFNYDMNEVILPIPVPESLHYEFLGWNTDKYAGYGVKKLVKKVNNENEELLYEPSNITLHAVWRNKNLPVYNITYNWDKSHVYNSEFIPKNYTEADEIKLQIPEMHKYYEFVAWHEGALDGPIVTKIQRESKGDKSFFAEIKPIEYTLTYEANSGVHENITSYTVETQDGIILKPATREGYYFRGWYLEDTYKTKVEKLTSINGFKPGNYKFYAKWEKICKITYIDEYNIVNNDNPTEIGEFESKSLYGLSKKGYTFNGWYNSKGEKVAKLEKITGDITLTSRWSVTKYTIEYSDRGLENPNPKEYTINSETIILQDLTGTDKNGMKFLGWYTYDKIDGVWHETKITEIPKGSTENIYITGKFEFIEPQMVEIAGNGSNISNLLVGKYEVTQKEFEVIMGNNPSTSPRDNDSPDRPVESLNFIEMVKYCNKLSVKSGRTPCYSINGESNPDYWDKNTNYNNLKCNFDVNGYRVPNLEEWLYIAKGGTVPKNKSFVGSENLDEVAWTKNNTGTDKTLTHKVGTKKENGYGIFDMNGNVAERIWDQGNDASQRSYIGGSIYDSLAQDFYWSNGLMLYGSTCIENTRTYWLGFRVVCTDNK